MSTEDREANLERLGLAGNSEIPATGESVSLRSEVEKALQRYFEEIGDESATDLYQMVLKEIESPLLMAVMRYTGNNQSKASTLLGLNRGTLRKKLKQHGML
ncbi:MAG: DNA-binding transcriptional regulator Fis [Pseudohongiellaceae bacterium]